MTYKGYPDNLPPCNMARNPQWDQICRILHDCVYGVFLVLYHCGRRGRRVGMYIQECTSFFTRSKYDKCSSYSRSRKRFIQFRLESWFFTGYKSRYSINNISLCSRWRNKKYNAGLWLDGKWFSNNLLSYLWFIRISWTAFC